MGKGFDTIKDASKIASLAVQDGYTFAAMYYYDTSGIKTLLTKERAAANRAAGLANVAVYENGSPIDPSYFTDTRASFDARVMVRRASAANQPTGTPIYWAADGDMPYSAVDAYSMIIHNYVKDHGYLTGVYGDGEVCRGIYEAGYANKTWLAGAKKWRGYQLWLPHADIVQGGEGVLHGISVDFDTSNGHAGGW